MYKTRIAIEQDIPQIKELFRQTILNVIIKDYSAEQVQCWASRGDDANIWKTRIREQYFIVAETENKIAGFAALKSDGYLNSLFVHKNFQEEGIATTLLDHMESYARQKGMKEITADVSITARSFFEKKGYTVLKDQIVDIGVKMKNFGMKKELK